MFIKPYFADENDNDIIQNRFEFAGPNSLIPVDEADLPEFHDEERELEFD